MENQPRPVKPSVTYTLFQYREELQRRNIIHMRLSKMKVQLTDELISRTVKNLKECSIDDLKAVSRELLFKKKLKRRISRISKMQKMGIKNPDPSATTAQV